MASTTDPEQLRIRARALRRVAGALDDCAATRLSERAGEDTWIGPTPQRCQDDLASVRAGIRAAHDELLTAARALDVQAALLETSAGGARVTVS